MSINNLQDMTIFFNKLQGFAINHNNDGLLTKEEVVQAYGAMPDEQIPQAIKDKFATPDQFGEAFDCIDPLGIKDYFINDQELYKYVSGDSNFKPWTPPAKVRTLTNHYPKPNEDISQNDMIAFFEKLESKTQNKDGVLTHIEAREAYQKLLCEDPGAIPDQVKDKLGAQGLSDLGVFNKIDKKGTKDGYINWQEMYKYASSDTNFHPWTPPESELSTPNFADAGYLVKNGDMNDAQASSQKLITDVEGLLGGQNGMFNDDASANGNLSKQEISMAITLVQAHRDTVENPDGKLKILQFLFRNFAEQSDGDVITVDSLSRNLQNSASPDGAGWS